MTKKLPGAEYAREENWHPYTKDYLHPKLEGDAFKDLCDEIREDGLDTPIILLDGKVLDGVARAKACVAVGEPLDFLRRPALPPRSRAVEDFYAEGSDRLQSNWEPEDWLRRMHGTTRVIHVARTKSTAEYDDVHDPGLIPAGQYQTMVADCPWDVDHATEKYPTMPVEHIMRMAQHRPTCWRADDTPNPKCRGCGVLKHTAANCHLYLWAINARLRDGLDVMEAWGFRYITQVTWNKTRGEGIRADGLVLPDHSGQGQGYRGTTEQILIGVKGRLPWRTSHFDTQFYAPRLGGHSVKPDEYFWPMVMRVSPGPYLELFARRLWSGLDASKGDAVWGNQAPKKGKAKK